MVIVNFKTSGRKYAIVLRQIAINATVLYQCYCSFRINGLLSWLKQDIFLSEVIIVNVGN